MGWNLPTALAALAPQPPPEYPSADVAIVRETLAGIAVPGEVDAVKAEMERIGVRFIARGEGIGLHLRDETVNGRIEPLTYGVVVSLCHTPSGAQLAGCIGVAVYVAFNTARYDFDVAVVARGMLQDR